MTEGNNSPEGNSLPKGSVASMNDSLDKPAPRSEADRAAARSEIFASLQAGQQSETGREYKDDGGFYLDASDDIEDEAETEDEVELDVEADEESESDEEHSEDEEEEAEADDESADSDGDVLELSEDECTTCAFGDKEIVVPNDAVFQVKVDGELQDVTFEEIKNGISGQKAIQQRFSILNEDRKIMEQHLQGWQENKSQFFNFMNEGRAVEALNVVFQEAGYSADVAYGALFEELLPYYEKYAAMSDQDRMAWSEQMRAERHKLQLETTQSELQRLQAEKEQLSKMKTVQEKHGLDDATFAELHSALKEEIRNGTLNIDPSSITPELIVEYGELVKQESWISEALAEVKLKDDELVGAYQDTLATINARRRRGVEISKESVAKLVQDVYGLSAKVNKSKKVTKVLKKKGHRGQPEGKAKAAADRSARGPAGKAPKHWMDAFTSDIDSAASPQERKERMNKWKNKR